MNFLAHIYLSGNDTNVMVGNFIGDFVKGRNFSAVYGPAISRGIALHRMIDEFTDQHPVVHQSKTKLRPKYRHYAAVIVDIFYDHFLSRHWDEYHTVPLPTFANDVYRILQAHRAVLPAGVQHMLPYMIKDNWLVNYGNLPGISQALRGISRRTKFDSRMNESIRELEDFYDEFKSEFQSFFPELHIQTKSFLVK